MIKLRDYQLEAVKEFEENNNVGIFDMATGTGKTFTSLYAANQNYHEKKEQFLVIVVPFVHLINQWSEDFHIFDIDYYLEIAYSKQLWVKKLKDWIWDYNKGYRKRVVVVGSYKSMMNKEFQELIKTIKRNTFLIADECHYIGSKEARKNNFSLFSAKLGLSATPRRWWDEEGSEAINRLFDRTVYTYSMEEAIEEKILTNYLYYPVKVELNEDEKSEYNQLSKKISRLMFRQVNDNELDEQLKMLVLKRARVIQNAEQKKERLYSLLKKQEVLSHTLVYCGIGQVSEIVESISNLGIRVHRFNSELNQFEREKILKRFSDGEIQVLVAIKCLDEGVDVPSTRTAYFLSSTSNPREFIQRRGRVLRKSKGKILSEIYDFIVLPDKPGTDRDLFKSIAEKEMPRFSEFSQFAINQYDAREQITPILRRYELDYLMDITPWEMYEQIKSKGESQ